MHRLRLTMSGRLEHEAELFGPSDGRRIIRRDPANVA